MSHSVAFYQFTKPEHKPLYIRYEASFGAGGSGSVEYNIVYDLNDSLETLSSRPCKVVDSAVRHVQPEKQENAEAIVKGKRGVEIRLSSEEISGIAARTFQYYRSGNVNRIFAEENSCWKKAENTRENSTKDKLFATCAASLFSGAMIEATYARSELRGSHPQYSPAVIRGRAQEVMEHITNNIDAVMSSLIGAGMR